MLTSLANAYRDLRRFDEATQLFHRAIAVARELGEPWVEAAAVSLLGMVHRDLRKLDEAGACGERSLAIFNTIDDPWGKAWAYHNLGESCGDLRRFDDAVTYSGLALALFRRSMIRGERAGRYRCWRRSTAAGGNSTTPPSTRPGHSPPSGPSVTASAKAWHSIRSAESNRTAGRSTPPGSRGLRHSPYSTSCRRRRPRPFARG